MGTAKCTSRAVSASTTQIRRGACAVAMTCMFFRSCCCCCCCRLLLLLLPLLPLLPPKAARSLHVPTAADKLSAAFRDRLLFSAAASYVAGFCCCCCDLHCLGTFVASETNGANSDNTITFDNRLRASCNYCSPSCKCVQCKKLLCGSVTSPLCH